MEQGMADLSALHLHNAALIAFLQIVLIDLTLAGDNSLVIGMTASRLSDASRRIAIFIGLLVALALRIALAYLAVWLLGFVGVKVLGGAVLIWVSGRLYNDVRHPREHRTELDGTRRGLMTAVFTIIVADASMSLDNILAVAAIAQPFMKTAPWVLFAGLTLSVALMGLAATFITRMLRRWPWISYIGIALIVYVAVKMIAEGGTNVVRVLHA